MQTLALLLCGFSIFSAITLVLIRFRGEFYQEQPSVRIMSSVFLLTLAGLQGFHFAFLNYQVDIESNELYYLLLYLVAPVFYLFSSPLLSAKRLDSPLLGLHFIPVALVFLLPTSFNLSASFGIGSLYLLWLGYRIYRLREHRQRFRLELLFLGVILLIGIMVMLSGLTSSLISTENFFAIYSIGIGAAFFVITLLLGYAPRIESDIKGAVNETYAVSTLGTVDIEMALTRLDQLMNEQQVFKESNLNSTELAERLQLSRHQLSELINTHLGKGVSRYIREKRVSAARAMLLNEPRASVLSVGLSVGFTSQSNFYQAFREYTRTVPPVVKSFTGYS